MTTTSARLKGAIAQVTSSGADGSNSRTDQVDKSLGANSYMDGKAPAYNKGLAHFVAKSPEMFGRKSIAEIFGVGEVPREGSTPGWVKQAINLRGKGYRHVDVDIKEELLEFKKAIHNAQLRHQIMVHKHKMPMRIEDNIDFLEYVVPKLKAFSLADFSAWVPTVNAGFYFEELDLDPVIDKYFPEYPMASKTVTVPGATARLKGRLESDTATFSAQYNTSGSYTLTAQDCVDHTDITEDLMDDMVPNAGGFERLRKEVALGIQRSKEDAIINGDDTGSVQGDGHMDSDIAGGAATLFNKAFKGLRKRALAASLGYDNASAGVSLSTYNGLLPVLGKFAKEKGDLLFIVGPTIANKIVTGGVPEILTMEKFGANATLQTGVLPKMFGVEQYESEWVREDVNSSGVYASAQSQTTLLIVKKSRFVVGSRSPMKIWATPSLASSDKMLLSAKERFSFGGIPQLAGTETSVAIAYGITLA